VSASSGVVGGAATAVAAQSDGVSGKNSCDDWLGMKALQIG
jgi:hypothetical protein